MSNERFAPADWLLNWLEERDHQTVSTTFEQLAGQCNHPIKDLQQAGFMCRELGPIRMQTDAGHSMFIGGLTGKGRALVFSRQSVGDLLHLQSNSSTTNNTINIVGDVHGGQVGINNKQTVTVQVTSEHVRNLIEALRQDGLTEVADAVEEETHDCKEPGRVIDGLQKGLSVASDTGTAVTSFGTVFYTLLSLLGVL